MKISFIVAVVLAATILAKDPVQVTVYATAEESEAHDYVEIVARIGQTDQSLPKALDRLKQKIAAVVDTVLTFCGDKEKKKCQETVEVGQPEFEGKYQLLRRVETFMNFVVEYEITIKVLKTDQIGVLVDNLQRLGIKKFESFTWKPLKEVDEQATVVESAVERVDALCGAIGQKIDRVVSIQHFTPEEEEEEEPEEEEEAKPEPEPEEEDEDQIYKLVFECVEKKGAAKA